MNSENNKSETSKKQMATGAGSDSSTQSIMERGAKAYGQAEEAVTEAYDKTTRTVNKTYEQARSYSYENPGKAIFIALGIGVGLGLILGASSHRSRTSRLAEPVVNALSDIALAYLR